MYVCFLNFSSSLPITEPLTSELIDTPVFYNLAPRPIKYRVSVPIPTDKRSETIPSSRITPDPLDSQLHCLFSSPHSCSTGFRSEDCSRSLVFFISDPFLCWFLRFVFGLLYSWKIQKWPIIRFLTVSHLLIFYLLVYNQ